MDEEAGGKIALIAKDIFASIVLIVGWFLIEYLKGILFRQHVPILLNIAVGITDLTLLVALARQLFKTIVETVRAFTTPATHHAVGDGPGLDAASVVVGGFRQAAKLGMVVGLILCALLAFAYFIALIGGAPTWLYYSLVGAGFAVIIVSIIISMVELSWVQQAESGAVVFVFIAVFIILCVLLVESLAAIDRYLFPGLLGGLIHTLLLRR